MLDPALVVLIHDFILDREPGVKGMNKGALEGALGRIEKAASLRESQRRV